MQKGFASQTGNPHPDQIPASKLLARLRGTGENKQGLLAFTVHTLRSDPVAQHGGVQDQAQTLQSYRPLRRHSGGGGEAGQQVDRRTRIKLGTGYVQGLGQFKIMPARAVENHTTFHTRTDAAPVQHSKLRQRLPCACHSLVCQPPDARLERGKADQGQYYQRR